MSQVVQLITQFLAAGTVAADAVIILLAAIFATFYFKKDFDFKPGRDIISFFGKNAVLFSFAVALASVIGSLYYSEIAGFEPCKLCWIQRIFIYPQAIILGMALRKEDIRVADYCIALSGIGAIFSAYHQYLQFGGRSLFACSINGVSCSQRLILQFGYVTIPMMMLTGFILIILLMSIYKKWFWEGKS